MGNDYWKKQPRVPAGNEGGGEWTASMTLDAIAHQKKLGAAANPKQLEKTEYKRVDAKSFHKALSEAKDTLALQKKWRVDLHPEEDYNRDRCYVTDYGSCFALEPSGNIISVCHKEGDPIKGYQLLARAIALGGDRLDAFGPELYDFYVRNGFEPVSWTPFNSEYAPEEWKEARSKGEDVSEESVIFYKYTGKQTNISYEDFLKTNPPYEGEDGYDEAMRKRDEEIKK